MSSNENRPIAFFPTLFLPLIACWPCQLMHLTSTRIGRSNPWAFVRTARERVGRERQGEWLAATATAISLLLQETRWHTGDDDDGTSAPPPGVSVRGVGAHSPGADVWAPATGAKGNADIEGSSPRAPRRHISSQEFAGPFFCHYTPWPDPILALLPGNTVTIRSERKHAATANNYHHQINIIDNRENINGKFGSGGLLLVMLTRN